MKVRLDIPEEFARKKANPELNGEHFAYDGKVGELIANAGCDGAYIQFGEDKNKYVGCPLDWLTVVK